jgi:hypothetical protein
MQTSAATWVVEAMEDTSTMAHLAQEQLASAATSANKMQLSLDSTPTTAQLTTPEVVLKAATLDKAMNSRLTPPQRALRVPRAALANTTTTLAFLQQPRTPTPSTPKAAKHLASQAQLESSQLERRTELKDHSTPTTMLLSTEPTVHLEPMVTTHTALTVDSREVNLAPSMTVPSEAITDIMAVITAVTSEATKALAITEAWAAGDTDSEDITEAWVDTWEDTTWEDTWEAENIWEDTWEDIWEDTWEAVSVKASRNTTALEKALEDTDTASVVTDTASVVTKVLAMVLAVAGEDISEDTTDTTDTTDLTICKSFLQGPPLALNPIANRLVSYAQLS